MSTSALKLSDRVYLLPPACANADVLNNPAPMILVFGFMGINAAGLERYIQPLIAQRPDSHFLLLIYQTSDFWAPQSRLKRFLMPAAELVDARIRQVGREKALGHAQAFSNGGAISACVLAQAMAGLNISQPALPIKSLVLDSAPGRATMALRIRAFSLFFDSSTFLIRWLVMAVYGLAILALSSLASVGLVTDRISSAREALLSPELFPADIPRLYLFSNADDIIAASDVHDHIDEAKRSGSGRIEWRNFEDSGHVRHAIKYKREYWSEVERFIGSSAQAGRGSEVASVKRFKSKL